MAEQEMIRRNTQVMKLLDMNSDGFLSFEDYEAAADMYMKLNPRVKDTGKVRYLEALKSVFEFLGLAEGEKNYDRRIGKKGT